jgi:glycosyltransferase involved in cell wall biosynthesis
VSKHPFGVIDAGGTYSQYVRAPAVCARHFSDADVLIDVQNGMPYFSPLWRRRPSVCLVHHVHTDQWGMRFPAPLAGVFRSVERRVMPAVYRNRRYVAISPSTATSLAAIGVRPDSITVIESGVDPVTGPVSARSPEPLLLSLNRLVPHKRIDLMLEAWSRAQAQIPGRLVIVGDGPLLSDLERQAKTIPRAEVIGRVDEATKEDLLAQAWAVLSAAHHEGWGMSVLEGAVYGTPTLAVDAPGIRDAVIDGVTGRLVHSVSEAELPREFGQAMVEFVNDTAQRERYGDAALHRAAELSWDHAIDRWQQVLYEAVASGTKAQT